MNDAISECRNLQVFEKVCTAYSRDLQRFIYTLTRKDPFAMEEIYQNTMLGALKGLNDLRDSSKMKSWIFSIAKAESKRYYAPDRPENRCECVITAGKVSFVPLYMADFTKSVEDKEYVKDLINSLSEEEQQLYILRYYYDLPLKEVSEILKVNYNTVRSMHMRGIAKLKKYLNPPTQQKNV